MGTIWFSNTLSCPHQKYMIMGLSNCVWTHCDNKRLYEREKTSGIICWDDCLVFIHRTCKNIDWWSFHNRTKPRKKFYFFSPNQEFWKYKNILIGLFSEHEKLGKITADYREEIEMNFKRITRHCKLVEAAVIVFNRSCSPDAQMKTTGLRSAHI